MEDVLGGDWFTRLSKRDNIWIVALYILVVVAYMNMLTTRKGLASIAGFTLLILAKLLQGSGVIDVEKLRVAGFVTLLASPSYNHSFDGLAAIGYVLAIFRKFDEAVVPFSLYNVMAASVSTSPLYVLARATLGIALILGWRNNYISV
jgi:hypothetical protein